MTETVLLRRVRLGDAHRPTGKTRHYYGSEILPLPSELRIVKYPNDPGFYLFYWDSNGREFTDTYHVSLERAISQAEWEFKVKQSDWEVMAEM